MSWSFGVKSTVDDFEAEANKQVASTLEGMTKFWQAEELDATQKQMESAVEAAITLVESGVLGSESVSAQLAGHANPGFSRKPGYSNNTITIQLHQQDND